MDGVVGGEYHGQLQPGRLQREAGAQGGRDAQLRGQRVQHLRAQIADDVPVVTLLISTRRWMRSFLLIRSVNNWQSF